MIVTICSLILIIIFVAIAVLHFYWGVGGRWAIERAVPTNERGERVLKTSPASCFVVGTGLLLFASYYLMHVVRVELPLPTIISNSVGWVIPSIFLLRAIGDFNYVGFTKKIKDTIFGRLDTTYFAPLCFLIATLGFAIKILR
jgi:hypothetical protein